MGCETFSTSNIAQCPIEPERATETEVVEAGAKAEAPELEPEAKADQENRKLLTEVQRKVPLKSAIRLRIIVEDEKKLLAHHYRAILMKR